jgi:hypothetical protein
LIGELFSNLRLFGKKLEYEYSETVAAIAKKALEDAALKRQFELENNDDVQVREAYLEAARTIWLAIIACVKHLLESSPQMAAYIT